MERIGGPVLLACGEQDLIWPSCGNVDAITERLRAHRFAHPVTALRNPDAGHLVGGLTAWYGSLTDDALTSLAAPWPAPRPTRTPSCSPCWHHSNQRTCARRNTKHASVPLRVSGLVRFVRSHLMLDRLASGEA